MRGEESQAGRKASLSRFVRPLVLRRPASTGSPTDIGSGSTREITVEMDSSNIKYVEDGGTGFGACASSTEQANGGYEGQAVVTAENALGAHLGICFA